ncbi:MAG: response regulator, partial [Verrucomicrobiales bacterium]
MPAIAPDERMMAVVRRTKAKILVVEDNLVNRRVLEGKLAGAGYVAVSKESGPDALEFLEKGEGAGIDLVLLDVMMPGMDGIEVLRRIRESRSAIQLPVIMTTSLDNTDDIVTALQAGANDYVTKPIDLAVLLSRLATHLNLKRVHQDLRESHRSLVQAAKMESVALLASGVAHEIRNPLAQIQLGLDSVRELAGSGDEAAFRELIDVMSASVARADAIVRGLMSAATNQKLQARPGDLNHLVSETWSLIEEEESVGANVTGRLELGEGLPPVSFDPGELRQVLINVFLNAAQAMPGGGVITVHTRGETVTGIPMVEGARSALHLRNGARA